MTLLDEAIEACGGTMRWNGLRRFTLQLSIGGAWLTRTGQAGRFKELAAEGSTRTQLVRFTGFTGPDRCGVYQPERVAIEGHDGEVLRAWNGPQPLLRDPAGDGPRDELHLVFICGCSVWNYLTTPFLLTHPDVTVHELPPAPGHDRPWRRLRALFPPDIVGHGFEQMFYFDGDGLQRRTDHDLLGTPVAHYSWAHQAFRGIVVPTLRRSLMRGPDGIVIPQPALIEVEIFDASFE